MKKAKIYALSLACALAGGTLIGCNQEQPAPEPVYYVNTTSSADYTISGINSDGYKHGETVSFTVTVTNPQDKEIKDVKMDTTTLVSSTSGYSFVMPEKDVTLTVTLRNIDKYALQALSDDVIVGIPVKFSLTLGTDAVASYDLSVSGNATVSASEHSVTFNEAGTFNVEAKVDEATVATQSVTVRQPKKGEIESNPLTAQEAVDICKTLTPSTSSETHATTESYYIEDVVTKMVESYAESGENHNVTFFLGEFEVFRAKVNDAELGAKIEVGAVVKVKSQMKMFNKTPETHGAAQIISADNSNATLIQIDQGHTLRSVQVGTSIELDVAVFPSGASAGLSATSSADTVASASISGSKVVVNGLTEGETVVTVSGGSISTTIKVKVVATEVHGESLDDPITGAQAAAICSTLETTTDSKDKKTTEIIYYVKDVLDSFKSFDTSYKNYEATAGGLTIYRARASLELGASLEKGSLVTISTQLMNYKGTPETDNADTLEVDNSKVTLFELNENDVDIQVGHTLELVANAFPVSLGATISWNSTNTEVATVENGVITAVSEGHATIKATCGSLTRTCDVTVVTGEVKNKWENSTSETLTNISDLQYPANNATSTEEFTIIGKLSNYAAEAEKTPTQFDISDREGLNTIKVFGMYDLTGLINYPDMDKKPVEGDVVVLKGKIQNFNGTKEIKYVKTLQINGVVCERPELTDFELTASAKIEIGEERKLDVTPVPLGASLEGLEWRSLNPDVATVNDGVVTGVATGNTTITATVNGISKSCAVEVVAKSNKVVFELGTDDSTKTDESNQDGTAANDYTETVGSTTLTLTDLVSVFKNSYDAKGHACLKLGTSSKNGSFKVTIPTGVSKVIFSVAGYKAYDGKFTIGSGSQQTTTKHSTNGEFEDFEYVINGETSLAFTSAGRLKITSIAFVF